MRLLQLSKCSTGQQPLCPYNSSELDHSNLSGACCLQLSELLHLKQALKDLLSILEVFQIFTGSPVKTPALVRQPFSHLNHALRLHYAYIDHSTLGL
jgi:hypothetical protein